MSILLGWIGLLVNVVLKASKLDDTTEAGQGVLDVVPEDEFVLIGVQHILVPMRDVVITDSLKIHHTFLHFCVLDALDENPDIKELWLSLFDLHVLEHIVSTIQECRRTIILHSFLEWVSII